jgi:O-antigen ligase
MFEKMSDNNLARVIGFGGFLTTIMVAAWWTIEPVNAPKMATLVATSGAVMGILLSNRGLIRDLSPQILIPGSIFSLLAMFTLISSADPWDLNFYGVSGRNTGLLTYLGLVVVYLGASALSSLQSISRVIKYFVFAGVFNVAYCLLSILGIELIPWNNIYNRILGTFGNPNFIGAFLGIFGVVTLSYIFSPDSKIRNKLIAFLVFFVTFIEIEKSDAIQGLVILAFGSSVIVWMKLRSLTANKIVEGAYLLLVTVAGVTSALGALQIGPLAKYIYKSSVSFRGEYWQAGFNMGLEKPFTGVGMDSYGSWYRRARDLQALVWPGADTTTNAAHNVFLDVLAYGGFPLLLAYLAILLIIARSAVRILFKSRSFDFVAASLITAWLCYLAQALISINQIGVAIWGWIFGGLIIAYDRVSNSAGLPVENSKKVKKKSVQRKRSEAALSLATTLGLVVGTAIAIPPVLSDARWKSALASGDGKQLEAAAIGWPQDPLRMSEAIKIFSDNNWTDTALRISQLSVSKFSDSYISWYSYLQMPTISDEERERAKSELRRLDPNNIAWK